MPSQAPHYEVNSVVAAPGLGNFFDVIPWGSTCIILPYHFHFRLSPRHRQQSPLPPFRGRASFCYQIKEAIS